MQEGFDNGNGMHVNTDPAGNGNGQVTGMDAPPMNQDGPTYPSSSNAPDQNGQPGTTFAELAAKKGFKSPDDLATSYAHLERKQSLQPSPQISGQPIPKTNSEPLDNSERALLYKLAQRAEIDDLKAKYNDVNDYATAILDKVKTVPGMPLEDAYMAVKYKAAQEAARQEGYNSGRQEGMTVAEQKMRAATTMPSARNDMPAPTIESQIKEAKTLKDLKALEATLPHR